MSWLAGDTADASIRKFICNLSFRARWAVYKFAVNTLIGRIQHTGHPWLTAALGFPVTGARGDLLKAQHRVTGAAHLADAEMVPVFIVVIWGASLASCVFVGAAYGRDKLAWGAARAADVMTGFVVFLVLVPACLVFNAIWGHRLGLSCHQEPAESQQEWPPGQAAGRGGRRQAHGGLSGSADQIGWRPGRKVGSPDVLSSGGHDFPSLAAGPTCPPGAGSGRAWPPGLQRRAQEVGVERAGRGRGQGALGAETGLSQSRRGGRGTGLAASTQGGRGCPGKHVRAASPEPGLHLSSEAWPPKGLRIKTTPWRNGGGAQSQGLTSKNLGQS